MPKILLLLHVFVASTVSTNVGSRSSGVSGAAVGGGMIASVIALISFALLILFAIWMIKKKARANETKLLG